MSIVLQMKVFHTMYRYDILHLTISIIPRLSLFFSLFLCMDIYIHTKFV